MTSELDALLHALRSELGCGAAVWMDEGEKGVVQRAGSMGGISPPPVAALPALGAQAVLPHIEGDVHVIALPPPSRGWLAVGPATASSLPLERIVRVLAPLVGQQLQATLEVEHAARELAERYEEINLLYTISEILGRTLTLEEATSTILDEIAETVGALRGAILVHDRATDTLQAVAYTDGDPSELLPIALDDAESASAKVFRTRQPVIIPEGQYACPAEQPYRRGAMMCVPILWTAPEGPVPLGIVNLSDRKSRQPFTAGDLKLVAAIATQIGTAIQNARLVRASLSQQRLMHEMQLAHDLQMRLLPDTRVVAPLADVAARVLPAESVGGDFYQLFRLGEGRVGVMLGDVSSHGYRAALIMALAMSAASIHAQGAADPGEVLAEVLDSLLDELESTEMYISLFYCVIDVKAGELRFANAGHPHAFVVGGDGSVDRLMATDPPLGMVDHSPGTCVRPWKPDDILLLFTDGVSDARDRHDVRLGEEAVLDAVVAARSSPPAAIVERVFRLLDAHTGATPRRDDLTLVVARSRE